MAEKDAYSGALHSVARMECDAIERARVAGEQARAAASKAKEQPAVVGVPALGPYVGEQTAMAAGAAMLAGLQALNATRWRVSMSLIGGGR